MEIFKPELKHLPGILAEAKSWFDQMDFALYGNGFDYAIVIPWLKKVITSNDFDSLLATEDGRVVGIFIVYYKTWHTWHVGPTHGCEMAWHANPSLLPVKRGKIMIRLIDGILPIVKERIKPEEPFFVGVDPRPEFASLQKYLEKRRFKDISHVMMIKGGDI